MSEIAVVLHGPSDPNGFLGESEDTLARVNASIDYINATGAGLVASGGFSDDAIDFLQRHTDIAGVDLIPEQLSRDTISNALYTRSLAGITEHESLTVITADYHTWRSRRIFSKVFASHVHVKSEEVPVEYPLRRRINNAYKELVLTGLTEVLLAGLDFDKENDLERAKLIARAAFANRYPHSLALDFPHQSQIE